MSSDPRYLTVHEVAGRLSLDDSTVYKMIGSRSALFDVNNAPHGSRGGFAG